MGDCISRQSVLDTLDTTDKFMDEERTVENYKALLKECYEVLPSVTPKQKPGKWIYTKAVSTGEIIWSECSVCGEGEHGCAKMVKFCPNCGAKMGESEVTQDSEVYYEYLDQVKRYIKCANDYPGGRKRGKQ